MRTSFKFQVSSFKLNRHHPCFERDNWKLETGNSELEARGAE